MRRPRHWLAVLVAAALVASTPSFGAHAASAATPAPSQDIGSQAGAEPGAAGSQRAATADQPNHPADQSDAAGTLEPATDDQPDAAGTLEPAADDQPAPRPELRTRAAGDQPDAAGGRQSNDPRFQTGSEAGTQPRATQPRGSGGSGTDPERPPIDVSGEYLGVMRLEELTTLPDPATDKIYVRGNRSANGVWSDGATLWVADGFSNQARFHKLDCQDDSSSECGVKYGRRVPTGSQFTTDGKKIHHDTVKALTAYDLGGGYRTPALDMPNTSYLVYDDTDDPTTGCSEDANDRSSADPGGGGACDGLVSPEGVWSDGDVVWVSDVSRIVKAYDVTSFADRSAGDTVDLLPDRSLTMPSGSVPRGIWSDGTTIWVADACYRKWEGDRCDGRLVAFDLETGNRDSGRDITGLQGYPDGVWSDGTTLWVSTTLDPERPDGPPPDDNDPAFPPDKVLAYEFDPEGGEAAPDPARDLDLTNHRNAAGLWSDGEQMWVADGGSAVHVYCLDRAASCHDAQERSTDATTALIYDIDDEVEDEDEDDDGPVADSFGLDTKNNNPTGAWSDGTNLYVLDATDNKLYEYNLNTGEFGVERTLASGNTEPRGLWSNGTTMWVADSMDNKLYAYTLDPWAYNSTLDYSLTGLDRDLDEDDLVASSLWGVWSDGDMIWVAHKFAGETTPARGRVAAFNFSGGSLLEDQTFDLSEANSTPRGISSDGDTLWVANDNPRKLFAYDLETGRHLPHKDVDILYVVFEGDSSSPSTTVAGVMTPAGLHIGDFGSGGPRRWPGTLPAECYETQTYFGFDLGVLSGHDPGKLPEECRRPFGRMMWLVDDDQDKVLAVRLHPALFDDPAPEDFAPSRASLRVTGSRELTLSWQPPAVGNTGLSGWVVQWRVQAAAGQTADAWTEVEIDDPGARSHTLENLTAGTAYEAQVLAVYADGTRSDFAYCADPDSTDPDNADGVPCEAGATAAAAPGQINLKVIPDVGELRLSWPAPPDGGRAITSYVVQYKLADDGSDYITLDRDADPTALTHTIAPLMDETPYTVRVRALSDANLYGPWAEATVSPGERTLLTDAVVAADTSDAYKLVRLEFNRALDMANLLDRQFFGVEIDDSGTALTPAVAAVHATDNDTVVLTMAADIAPGVPVTVSYDDDDTNDNTTGVVQDADGRDALAFADEIVLNRPGPPTGVTQTAAGRLLATIRQVCWEEPSFDGAAGSTLDIINYRVQHRNITDNHEWDDDDPTKDDHTDDGTEFCIQVNLGTFGKSYEIRVAAINEAGQGSYSEVVRGDVLNMPGEARNLRFEFEETGGAVLLSWSAPDDDGGITGLPAPVLSYRYWLFNSRTNETTLAQITVGENHAGDLNDAVGEFAFRNSIPSSSVPEAGDVIRMQVNIRNGGSLSVTNYWQIFVLGDEGEPGSVAAALSSGGLAVSWKAPENADRGDDVDDEYDLDVSGYEIRYRDADDDTASWILAEAAKTATGYTIPSGDLTLGEHYDVQIRAVISYDSDTYYGDWSDSVTADNPFIVDGAIGVSGRQNAADTYGLNNVIEFTATFSENVTVTGDPVLEFCLNADTESCTDDAAQRDAAYSTTKSSADTAVFTYTVLAADTDADGISFAADAIKLDTDAGDVDSITGTTSDAVAADLSHAALAADSDRKVDGSIVADLTPPTVASAKVIEDGTKIEIAFDEPLDETSTPNRPNFAVQVTVGTGTPSNAVPTSVAISGDTVTLTMPSAGTIAAGAVVTVSYTQPTQPNDDPLQDLAPAPNQVESFTGRAVLNRPAAPTGLRLTPQDARIVARWNAPDAVGGSAIDRYEVAYKLAAAAESAYTAASGVDSVTRVVLIDSLANDTEYTVRVRAVNAGGPGPWSGEVSATPETLPQVASAQVDADNPDRIVLTFDKGLDTNSVPAPSAFAVAEIDAAVAETILTVSAVGIDPADTVTLTLAADVTAGDRVRAEYSPPATGALMTATGFAALYWRGSVLNRPAAPAVSLTPGDTQITARWGAPANGGSAIRGYRVEWRTGAQTWGQAVTADQFAEPTGRSYVITDLTNDIEYTVRVHAVNSVGAGPWSDEVSETPVEADTVAPLVLETSLGADSEGDYKIVTITFDEPLDPDSVPGESAFGVTVDGGTDVEPASVAISGAAVTLTMDDEIVAGAAVTVAYTVPTGTGAEPLQDLADDPDPNAVASFTGTSAVVVPNRPAAPALTLAPAAGQITASWDAVTADGASTVTGYEVQYKAAADSGYTTVSRANTAALSETITNLVDGTSYTVRVRAVNNAGAGPWAEAATVAGDAYPAPDGPWLFDGGLDGGLNDPDIGEVLVRWLPPTSAASDADLQGWEIQWRSGSEEWSTDRQRYVERDRNDGGLSFESEFGRHSYGTEYEFRVRARVTGRASLWTDAAAVTVTMHSAPANMSAQDAYFGDHNDEPSDDTVSEKVIVRFYDSLERTVIDEGDDKGLVEVKLVRSLWMESYHRDETVPITGASLLFGAEGRKCNRWGREGDGFEDNDNIEIEILHPGAARDDWEHVGWSGNRYEVAQRNFDCIFKFRGIRPRNVVAAAQDNVTEPGKGNYPMVDPDPDVAVLSGAVSLAGALTIRWQPEMWAGARVLADFSQEGFEGTALPKTDHFPVIQWVAADEEFLDDLYEAANNAGDNAGVYALDGDELKAALLAAEYTITGLENGTAYKVRFAYGDGGADQSVSTRLTSNVVTGTPEVTEPVPASAAVSEDGQSIDIVFDQDLDTSVSAPAASAFAVTVGTESAVNPAGAAFHAADADTITLTMGSADTIAAGDTVSVAYTKPSANVIQNSNDQEAESFTVSAANRPAAPGTLTLTPGVGTLDVAWTAPAGSAVTGYTVQWRTGSQTWDDAVAEGQADSAAASPYQITGLAPEAHTVRVIATNVAGSGPPSPEQTATPTAAQPTVTAVSVTSTPKAASDTYGLGEDIEITVEFSEAVKVDGDVIFRFNTSGADSQRQARLARGSDTKNLVFSYTVQSGDIDTNGIWIGDPDHANHPTLSLDTGQSIASVLSGLEALPAHDSQGRQDDHKVDGSLTGADATLSALSLSGITLDQTFTAGAAGTATTSFTATTTASSTTVTATATQSGGSSDVVITPADADTTTTGHQVTLATDAATVITVVVTSTNGNSTRTYTITVTRQAVSSDATLSDLTVDGTSVDGFAAADTSYTVTVDGDTTQVTVAATASDANATVEIAPADADTGTGGHQVDLAGGSNEVAVTVTAEDDTTKVYTVTVHRAAVPHDWSLRPDGVATGESFRLLLVTSTERDATSGDIADYDAHVQSALANRGHADIVDYSPLFKALAATQGGALPRSHTGTDPTDDGPGEEIWWLDGPKAADDYADFYDDDGWDHSTPARTESGDSKTFYHVDDISEDIADRIVWTGTWLNGTASNGDTRSLGTISEESGGQLWAFVGGPYQNDTVWVIVTAQDMAHALVTGNSLGLYGLSDTLYIEEPDAPYATVAAVSSEPDNEIYYRTGETIEVTVTFSEAVAVDTASGTPSLPLVIGSDTPDAGYESIDSTGTVLTFSYDVVSGDEDLDGISVDGFSLELNGGSITGTTGGHDGVAAVLTHAGVAADENQRVNGPPLITGVEVTSTAQATAAGDTYGLGEDIEITVTFGEAVNVTGDAMEGDVEFGLNVGGPKRARLKSGNGTDALVFVYTVQAGDSDEQRHLDRSTTTHDSTRPSTSRAASPSPAPTRASPRCWSTTR